MDFIGTKHDIGSKIFASYEAKAKEANLDSCEIDSYSKLGERSVKFVLASTNPTLSVEEAKKTIFNKFNHKLLPLANTFTASISRENGKYYSTIIASRAAVLVEPFDGNDTSKVCLNANATMFLDQNLGCTWERKNINGKDCFIRNNEEDVDSVLKACMSASIKEQDGRFDVKANAGDYVAFVGFEGDACAPFVEVGQVTNVIGGATNLCVENNGIRIDTVVPTNSILHAVPVEAATSRKEVIEYLIRAYGPGFKEILKETKAFTPSFKMENPNNNYI